MVTPDPGTDIGHIVPQPIWDAIDHDAAQSHVPDPQAVAAQYEFLRSIGIEVPQ